MLDVIQALPDDARVEDAIDELYVLFKMRRGLEQYHAGECVTQEEIEAEVASWPE